VARGEAEIGMQQINVILPVVGADDYVGPSGNTHAPCVIIGERLAEILNA
jgi:hypothetical protein